MKASKFVVVKCTEEALRCPECDSQTFCNVEVHTGCVYVECCICETVIQCENEGHGD